MPSDALIRWSERLERAALATLGGAEPERIAAMVNGPLSSLPMAALVARALGVPTDESQREPKSLDERLWASVSGMTAPPVAPGSPGGPIIGNNTSAAIEVWTETELACVHAAWSLGEAWRDAARASALWLLGHIQPDNATNHPWAVHVFAALAEETGNPEMDLYAQTLLHNCVVTTGRPDAFSALILLHASRAIQAC